MRRFFVTHRLIAALLLVCSIIAVEAVVSLFFPVYGEICRKNELTGREACAAHHIAAVVFWEIGEFLNYYGVAITAIATAFIGYFTYTLYKSSVAQAELTRASIDLGNREFIATHRPRLRVRRMSLATPTHGAPLKITYEIVNNGESEAVSVKGQVQVTIHTPARPEQVNSYETVELNESIPVGRSVLTVYAMPMPYEGRWNLTGGGAPTLGTLIFHGVIEYCDLNRIERRTAFSRTWNFTDGSFSPSGDSDWEYQD